MCTAHLDHRATSREPGVYLYDPQGHALLVGSDPTGEVRTLVVLDLDGVVSVAGVEVRDPDHLDRMAERLHTNADRLRRRRTGPVPAGTDG